MSNIELDDIDLTDFDDFEPKVPSKIPKKVSTIIDITQNTPPKKTKIDLTLDEFETCTPHKIAKLDLTGDQIIEESSDKIESDTSPFKCKICNIEKNIYYYIVVIF